MLRKSGLTLLFLGLISLYSASTSLAAKFGLEAAPSVQDLGPWPVAVSLHNPEAGSNNGIVGVRLKLLYDPRLVISDTDIQTILPSPWSYVRRQVSPGEILIEAIYVKAGTTGDMSLTPQKFVVVNFHPKGSGKAQVRVDAANSMILTKKDNKNILETQSPAKAEVAINSQAGISGFFPTLSQFFRNLLRSLNLAK
jgi:hypothetical protein